MSTSSLPCRAGARSGAVGLAALAVTGVALLAAPAVLAAPGDNGDVTPRMQGVAVAQQAGRPAVCRFQLDATGFDTVQGLDWSVEPQPAKADGTSLSGSLSLAQGAAKSDSMTIPEGPYRLTWKLLGGGGAGKQKDFKAACSDAGQAAASPSAASPSAASPSAASPSAASPSAARPSAVPESARPSVAGPQAATGQAVRPSTSVSRPAVPGSAAPGSAGPRAAIGPNGGPPAGGGGLARDFSTVAGAAAVGSAAIGGAVYLRMRRRRADGAA